MPFSNQVIITMKPLENFSSPPGEFRDKMTGELKIFFGRKLAPDIWADLERSLWASVQKLPLFKQQKLMIQLKSMTEEDGNFNKLYLTKRPDVWPRWDLDEVSEDDEEVPPDVLFAMIVNIRVVKMDSLQKCSALLIGKMKPEFQIYNGKPLPKILHSLVNDLTNKDLCK